MDFSDFSGYSYFFMDFSDCFAVVRELFCGIQRLQLLFYGFFRLFRCGLGSCFVEFSGYSYFFMDFSGCFACFGELFCGIQRLQLLFYGFFRLFRCGLGSCFVDFGGYSYFFPRIFPAFGLDWGAVLEVLWITVV